VADPTRRLDAAGIQNHPWLTKTIKTSQVNVLEKMREWDTKRKLETLNKKASRTKIQGAENSSDDL